MQTKRCFADSCTPARAGKSGLPSPLAAAGKQCTGQSSPAAIVTFIRNRARSAIHSVSSAGREHRRNPAPTHDRIGRRPNGPKSPMRTSIDELATLADKSGVYAAGAVTRLAPPWPVKPRRPKRCTFQTLVDCDNETVELLLIRMNHSWEVPRLLPRLRRLERLPAPRTARRRPPRSWRREYHAFPPA